MAFRFDKFSETDCDCDVIAQPISTIQSTILVRLELQVMSSGPIRNLSTLPHNHMPSASHFIPDSEVIFIVMVAHCTTAFKKQRFIKLQQWYTDKGKGEVFCASKCHSFSLTLQVAIFSAQTIHVIIPHKYSSSHTIYMF